MQLFEYSSQSPVIQTGPPTCDPVIRCWLASRSLIKLVATGREKQEDGDNNELLLYCKLGGGGNPSPLLI